MNGKYDTTIKLLNILQLLGWLGMVIGLYGLYRVYSDAGLLQAMMVAWPTVIASMILMAGCQIGGVLIDIAIAARAERAGQTDAP